VTRGKGVIRDETVRMAAVARVREAITEAGFELKAEADSVLEGPKGNRERFVFAQRLPDDDEPEAA
jgi:23S rRNA (cytidine1920-2'-O)/16S rRNA (cytidine1409-2'-O)-methyltransferase